MGAKLHTFLNSALSRGECSVEHCSSDLVACIAYLYALKNREMYCLWRQTYTISSVTGRLPCLYADWCNVALCCRSLSRPTAFETDYACLGTFVWCWKVWIQVHGVLLLLKQEKFSQGLNGVFRLALSMSSYEVTLHLALWRSTLQSVIVLMYILDVSNGGLAVSSLSDQILLWLKYVLASDHCLYFQITQEYYCFLCTILSLFLCLNVEQPSLLPLI